MQKKIMHQGLFEENRVETLVNCMSVEYSLFLLVKLLGRNNKK